MMSPLLVSKELAKKDIAPFLVKENITIKEAMRLMGKIPSRILFVVNDRNQLLGTLTEGDIRRWILGDGALTAEIKDAINKEPVFLEEQGNFEEVKKVMIQKKLYGVPVVQKNRVVIDVIFPNVLDGDGIHMVKEKINLPVVIMAGGKGTRLDPFTKVLPKPLIPIGDKTIIEVIMERFYDYEVNVFYLTINHRSKMLKAYFEENRKNYRIQYIEEAQPLGTAGGLRFLKDKFDANDLIVTNCDIIIRCDYSDIIGFHKKTDNDITIVGSFRHFTIPYGICRIQEGGNLLHIDEKPEYDFLVNTGMYILKKKVLEIIPEETHYDFTDLINDIKKKNGKIGVYPIDENSWIDVGQWEEYHRAVQSLGIKA